MIVDFAKRFWSGILELKTAAGQHRFKAGLIDGFDVGVERLDGAVLDVFEEGVVEHDHSVIFTGLHGRRYLECFAFADQVADGRCDDQHLESRDAAAAFFRQQRLGDDAL